MKAESMMECFSVKIDEWVEPWIFRVLIGEELWSSAPNI